jgi:hypothetical protein
MSAARVHIFQSVHLIIYRIDRKLKYKFYAFLLLLLLLLLLILLLLLLLLALRPLVHLSLLEVSQQNIFFYGVGV